MCGIWGTSVSVAAIDFAVCSSIKCLCWRQASPKGSVFRFTSSLCCAREEYSYILNMMPKVFSKAFAVCLTISVISGTLAHYKTWHFCDIFRVARKPKCPEAIQWSRQDFFDLVEASMPFEGGDGICFAQVHQKVSGMESISSQVLEDSDKFFQMTLIILWAYMFVFLSIILIIPNFVFCLS